MHLIWHTKDNDAKGTHIGKKSLEKFHTVYRGEIVQEVTKSLQYYNCGIAHYFVYCIFP